MTGKAKRPWRLEWVVAGTAADAPDSAYIVSSEFSTRGLALIAQAVQGALHGDRRYRVMKNVHFEAKS